MNSLSNDQCPFHFQERVKQFAFRKRRSSFSRDFVVMAYPKPSSDVEEVENVEGEPRVVLPDLDELSSATNSDSETEGSFEDDDDECASKKSGDGQDTDKDDEKRDPPPSASATAASSTDDVSFRFVGFKPFDKEKEKSIKDDVKKHTDEELVKMKDNANKVIKDAYEQHKYLIAIRAEEKRREKAKNKKEEEKVEKEPYVPPVVTINVKFNGKNYPVSLPSDATGKSLRDALRASHPTVFKTDKMLKRLRYYYNGQNLADHVRRELGSGSSGKTGWGMKDGDTVEAMVKGAVGGKGVKKSHVIKLKNINPTTTTDEKIFIDAFKASTEACSFVDINVDGMLKTLDDETLETLRYYLAHNKTTSEVKLQKIGEYSHQFIKMNKAISKMEFAQNHIKEVIFNALIQKYATKDGAIKMTEFQKDVEVQIGIRGAQKDDTKMKDWDNDLSSSPDAFSFSRTILLNGCGAWHNAHDQMCWEDALCSIMRCVASLPAMLHST